MIIFKEGSSRKEFSDETVENAWNEADGRCEKCDKELVWENRGRENGRGCWEAHHKDGNSENNKEKNCRILCWECHKKTFGEDKKNTIVFPKKTRLGIRKPK
jgi:hypothetical protein